MRQEQQRVEMQLPEKFHQQQIVIKVIKGSLLLTMGLSVSVLFSSLSPIKVVHESFFMTIGALLFLLYGNMSKDVCEMSNRMLLTDPVTMILGGITLIIVLRVPYYFVPIVIVYLILIVVSLLDYFKLPRSGSEKYILFLIYLVLGTLTTYFIVDQGYLQIELSTLMFPFTLLFMAVPFGMVFIYGIEMRDIIIPHRVYQSSILNTTIWIVLLQVLVINYCLFLLGFYLPQQLFVTALLWAQGSTFIFWVVVQIFGEQIILLCLGRKFKRDTTIFRLHYRQYQQYLYYQGRNINIDSMERERNKQKCIQCKNCAEMVYQPCGHLLRCQKCDQKRIVKQYSFCCLCSNQILSRKKLSVDKGRVRYGYSRKFFIEKKLCQNQFLIQD